MQLIQVDDQLADLTAVEQGRLGAFENVSLDMCAIIDRVNQHSHFLVAPTQECRTKKTRSISGNVRGQLAVITLRLIDYPCISVSEPQQPLMCFGPVCTYAVAKCNIARSANPQPASLGEHSHYRDSDGEYSPSACPLILCSHSSEQVLMLCSVPSIHRVPLSDTQTL
ncbi:hypothetical protein SRHO_G00278770 [Serrasalmus rhombeus]